MQAWRNEGAEGLCGFLLNNLFSFRERGREGQREGKKHQLAASCMPPTADLAPNPGMCPEWE